MSKTLFATKPWTWTPLPGGIQPKKYEPRTGPVMRTIEIDDPLHTSNINRKLLEETPLSNAQMFAMMNMSADYRHQAIWHYARQNIFAIPPFTFGTFLQLKDMGLAFKPEGSRLHKLTPEASALANAVADHLQQEHQIHAPMIIHTPRSQITKQVTFRCTCKWTCGLVAGNNMQLKASRAFASHLRSINAVAKIAEAVTIAPRGEG